MSNPWYDIFDARIRSMLYRNNIKSINELRKIKPRDMLYWKGCGKKTVATIQAYLDTVSPFNLRDVDNATDEEKEVFGEWYAMIDGPLDEDGDYPDYWPFNWEDLLEAFMGGIDFQARKQKLTKEKT